MKHLEEFAIAWRFRNVLIWLGLVTHNETVRLADDISRWEEK